MKTASASSTQASETAASASEAAASSTEAGVASEQLQSPTKLSIPEENILTPS